MKILYFANNFPERSDVTNGIFNYYRVKHLLKKNIAVTVVRACSFFSDNHDYNIKEIGYSENISVKYIKYFGSSKLNLELFKDALIAKKMHSFYVSGGYDLIHVHFTRDAYPAYMLCKKYNIPYVVTAHGSDIHTYPYTGKIALRKTLAILNNASKVIFVSNNLKKVALALGYNGKNATVITNGIDLEKFSCSADQKNKQRAKVVGYLGDLLPVKGADRLPDIFKMIANVNKDCVFEIAGAGYLREAIERKIEEYGLKERTIFPGLVHPNAVPKLLAGFSVVVMPSRREGFGCVALEAQACGIPVVGTMSGGLPEAIGTGGRVIKDDNFFIKNIPLASIIFLLGSFIAVYAMVLSPYFPPRAWFGVIVYFIIAIGILYSELSFSDILFRKISLYLFIISMVVFVVGYFFAYKDVVNTYLLYKEREQYIINEKGKGNLDVITFKINRSTKHNGFLSDIKKDKDDWLNKSVSDYYGLNSIVVK